MEERGGTHTLRENARVRARYEASPFWLQTDPPVLREGGEGLGSWFATCGEKRGGTHT